MIHVYHVYGTSLPYHFPLMELVPYTEFIPQDITLTWMDA